MISNSDRPHRFVVHGIYELPFGPGRALLGSANPLINRIVGGWQLNWVVTYQSMNALEFGGNGADRLFRSGNDPKTVDQWFDVTQFAPREPFTLRTLSTRVADLRAQGIRRWDVTVMKKTRLSEGAELTIQGEFYNAWNTTHFGSPNTTVTNASFGRITGTFLGPREIQLAMRVSF